MLSNVKFRAKILPASTVMLIGMALKSNVALYDSAKDEEFSEA
ncbi:hypothetical protein [Azospirillum rugosum]|uniref:Uncharacterized protein n=1 Tax=Azospirillum rugosum TaxID=416170 RepID=A0ABS4SR94_9PROT|nr:hypothetical protein [Azospirillum rugosum]MBP2295070.1 hypothetical protein [Azospirillum rugosum]MDQ0528893.1 hypothetical protein [Azospirillum rugosum]